MRMPVGADLQVLKIVVMSLWAAAVPLMTVAAWQRQCCPTQRLQRQGWAATVWLVGMYPLAWLTPMLA